jgi:hypothetical protein
MIRRVFWMTVGAVGGIMGYRRAVSLGRQVKGRGVTRDALRGVRGIRSFSRDVREGMEQYSARRPRAIGPTLPATNNKPATNNNDVNEKDDR